MHTYIHIRYLLFVMMLSLVGYGVHDEDAALWLLPHLQSVKEPAKLLGTYIKDLIPGVSKEYKDFAVKSLPPNASAAGIRKGTIDYLDGLIPGRNSQSPPYNSSCYTTSLHEMTENLTFHKLSQIKMSAKSVDRPLITLTVCRS